MYFYNIKIGQDLILRLYENVKGNKKSVTELVNETIREYLDSTMIRIKENETIIRLQPGSNYKIISNPVKKNVQSEN